MITINNFTSEYANIKGKLPEPLAKDKFKKAKTMYDNGMHKKSDAIEKYLKTFVAKLNEFEAKKGNSRPKPNAQKSNQSKYKGKKVEIRKASPHSKMYVIWDIEKDSVFANEKFKSKISAKKFIKQNGMQLIEKARPKAKGQKPTAKKVNYDFKKRDTKIPEEVRLFRRYLRLDGKKVTERQILLLYKAIEKAAVTRSITKESKWKKEIEAISRELAKTYNDKEGSFSYKIPEALKKKIVPVVEQTDELISVKLIKSFLSFITKQDVKKARSLKTRIDNALKNGAIPKNDRYITKVKGISRKLANYINSKAEVALPQTEVNGLSGIAGVEKKKSSEKFKIKPGEIISSVAVAKAHFDRLPFTGKWKKFIGEPDEPFAIMIYGRPGQGKSSLAILFAKYLAENFGKVLYVGKEEGVSGTLQEKINRFNASDPNLFFTSQLPQSITGFKYIFLDSVNALGLSSDQLSKLYDKNPTRSFISVFKGTKGGDFRGNLEYEHDVDTSIKCENGVASLNKNRLGGQGEMKIW
jgi:hypothetical protein